MLLLVSPRIFVNRPLSSIETALLTETKNDARTECPLPSILTIIFRFANATNHHRSSHFARPLTTPDENLILVKVNLPGLTKY